MEILAILMPFLVPLVFVALLGLWGRQREKSHLADLDRRSAQVAGFLVVDTASIPPGVSASRAWLVEGSAVVGAHRGKLFKSQIRNIIGGEQKSLSATNEAARREAQLRMIESAKANGAGAIVNMRINHSAVSSGTQIATEVLVTGTAAS